MGRDVSLLDSRYQTEEQGWEVCGHPRRTFSIFSAVRLPNSVGRDVSLLQPRSQTEEQASMPFRNRHSEPESRMLVFTSAPIFFVAKENYYPKRKRRKFQNPALLDSHQATKPGFRRCAGDVRLVHFCSKTAKGLAFTEYSLWPRQSVKQTENLSPWLL